MTSKKAKTAFELAMEKIDRMPKLDKKEIEKQNKKELAEKSEAIVHRYFHGSLKIQNLEQEISQFDNNEQPMVRKNLLNQLKESIGLIDREMNTKVLAAIQQLDGKVDLVKINSDLDNIILKYQHQRQKEYANLEKEELKQLQKMGIAGSAVAPNIQKSENWLLTEEKLKNQFDQKLVKIREMLP